MVLLPVLGSPVWVAPGGPWVEPRVESRVEPRWSSDGAPVERAPKIGWSRPSGSTQVRWSFGYKRAEKLRKIQSANSAANSSCQQACWPARTNRRTNLGLSGPGLLKPGLAGSEYPEVPGYVCSTINRKCQYSKSRASRAMSREQSSSETVPKNVYVSIRKHAQLQLCPQECLEANHDGSTNAGGTTIQLCVT